METATLKSNLYQVNDYRSPDCTLSPFNLPSLIATMKQSYSWANGELNAMILLKRPDKKIILTAMHEETEIESFQSNDSITFQIIEGKLKFHTRKGTVTLNEGQLLTFDENAKYRLTTQEVTVFLLTLSNSINISTNN